MKIPTLLAALNRGMIVALVAASAPWSLAQPSNLVVVPNSLANVEGPTGNSYPFNIGTDTMRYQQVFAASQFSAFPVGGAFITGIAFRRDANWDDFSATLPEVQIHLSITSSWPDQLGTIFADNVGADDLVVFEGPLSLTSSAGGSPAGFDILIPFSTAFFYDPAAGNLLLDVRNSGGGSSSQFDAVSAEGDSVSRAYNPVDSSSGSIDTLGLVTEFVFQSAQQPPLLIVQPEEQRVSCGADAVFRAGAVGFAPLFYQWRRNGRDLAGFTIQVLTLPKAELPMAGVYDVVVANRYGSVTSAPVALTVVDPTPYALSVAPQGGGAGVVLSWPITCASYVLQEATSLDPIPTWTAVPVPPLLANGSNSVTLPLARDSRFYRLISSDAEANVVAGRWKENGPGLAGRLSGIVASPTDPNTLLVSSPGGGVWRTTDGGATWAQPVNYALGDYSVLHLEWDRIRSGRLYASTYSDLYATTDLGDHWSNLTHFGGYPAPLMPLDHTSDPKPFAQLVYAAGVPLSTVFWSKPCLGLYYSYDGSTFIHHWPFSGGATNPDNCILAIAADDATGYVYFSTMRRDPFGPAPWTATTPCLSWVPANAGLPNNSLVADIAFGGSANVLAAAVNAPSSTLVYTTSSGTTWTAAAQQPPDPAWDPRVLVSPAPNSCCWRRFWGTKPTTGVPPGIRPGLPACTRMSAHFTGITINPVTTCG